MRATAYLDKNKELSWKQKIGFIKRVDKGLITTVKDLESWRFEGLTLETSAFYIFHGGNSTFANSFDKTRREGASLLFSPIHPRSTHHYQCDVT